MTSRVTPGLFGLMEGQWVCQARGSHHKPLHHNAIRAAKNNNCTPAPPPVQRILQERGLVQAPKAESARASPPRETASILWKELEKAGNPASAERGERGRDGRDGRDGQDGQDGRDGQAGDMVVSRTAAGMQAFAAYRFALNQILAT